MKNFIGTLKKHKIIYNLISVIIIFIIWYLSSIIINNELIIPKISSVLSSIINILKDSSNLLVIFYTLIRLTFSIIIAFILSIIILLLVIWRKNLVNLFRPIITIFKTIPVAAIIIILLIWFGSQKSPIVITTLIIFPIMIESFLTGIDNIEAGYIEELKINGDNYWVSIFKVYLPMISPFIYMGFIQSLGLGVKVLVTAELISQTRNSVGNKLYLHKIYLDMPGLFAWVLIVVLIVILLELFIYFVKRKINI